MIGGSARNPASSAGYWTQKANPILTIGAGEVNNSWGYTAAAGQESDIELWRSLSPAFTNPELVRVVAPHNPNVSWQAKDFEMLSVITSDIEKITYPNDKLYILTSGSDASDVWRQGLIVESDIDAALAMM